MPRLAAPLPTADVEAVVLERHMMDIRQVGEVWHRWENRKRKEGQKTQARRVGSERFGRGEQ